MKKYISILIACVFALAFNSQAQEKMDSSMVNANEHHCCKKDTTAKTGNTADMKDCKHQKSVCCNKDAAKDCKMPTMKNHKHDTKTSCCSKGNSTDEKTCCMKEGAGSCCGSEKKEKSNTKECPMHKG